jgi:hypothetical protein
VADVEVVTDLVIFTCDWSVDDVFMIDLGGDGCAVDIRVDTFGFVCEFMLVFDVAAVCDNVLVGVTLAAVDGVAALFIGRDEGKREEDGDVDEVDSNSDSARANGIDASRRGTLLVDDSMLDAVGAELACWADGDVEIGGLSSGLLDGSLDSMHVDESIVCRIEPPTIFLFSILLRIF